MVILRNRLSAEQRKKGKQEKDSKIPGGSGTSKLDDAREGLVPEF
jgi:hypothetical protein